MADDEVTRAVQANEVAGIVIDQMALHLPDTFANLSLRYGIADALWDAGYRRPDPTPPAGLVVPGWRDNQGDIWHEGPDGLLYSHETAPFTREHVEAKWGPISLLPLTPRQCEYEREHPEHGWSADGPAGYWCEGIPAPTPEPSTESGLEITDA